MGLEDQEVPRVLLPLELEGSPKVTARPLPPRTPLLGSLSALL